MTKKIIVVIDYNSGNLYSVFNALNSVKSPEHLIKISNNPNHLKSATHIILPGVGAFSDCISNLLSIKGMIEELKIQVLVNKKPFLGICVGMQLLADFGFEYGKTHGLGLINGNVVEIKQTNNLKIPHIGWNNIKIKQRNSILDGILDGDHFYFVHSFHFLPKNDSNILATFNYGDEMVAIINKENITATQFHPEKSSEPGLKLLKNFIR